MDFLFERAILYQDKFNDYEAALRDYLMVIELDTDTAFAQSKYLYNNIADLYRYNIKDNTKALAYYNLEIELSPESALGYLNRARLYAEEIKKLEKAEADYSKAIALAREDAINYYYRAQLYMTQGLFDQALADYTKAVELDPTDMDFLYARALLYQNKFNNYEAALRDYLKVKELDTNTAFAQSEYLYNNIAQLYRYNIKDNTKALAYYNLEIELSPESALGYLNRARLYAEEIKKLEKAEADYSKAIALAPEDAINYYYRAQLYKTQGLFDQALADYTTAVELDPTDMDFLFERALLYQNKFNDYEAALSNYLKVIELDTDTAFAQSEYLYNNIALLYRYDIKDNTKALDYYNLEIELSPVSAEGYRNRANLYEDELNDLEQAEADYSKVIALAPEDAINYYYRAQFYKTQGLFDQALVDYTTAIALDSTNMKYLYERALLYQNKFNDYEAALSNYLKVIELDTDTAFAQSEYLYNNIALLYRYDIKDNTKALAYYNLEIELSPESALGYISRANLYEDELNDLEQAREDYIKAISLDPKERNPYFNLVNFYIKTNDIKSALLTIDKTIVMDYNDPDGYYKKALIYNSNDQPIKALIAVSHSILKAEEEDRLDKGDYYISDLNNISRISLADLYAFRASLFSSLGYKDSACEDWYDALLKDKGTIDQASIQEKIAVGCYQ